MARRRPGWRGVDSSRRGDIFHASFVPVSGRERRGSRFVLVVSPDRFDTKTGAPITTGGGLARAQGFSVPLTGPELPTDGIARRDPPRTLDLKARGAKRIESVPDYIMDDVLARSSVFIE